MPPTHPLVAACAPNASPSLTGAPECPTPSGVGTSDLRIINREFAGFLRSEIDDDIANASGNVLAVVQPLDADLTAIAALTSAANRLPYATGSGTWAMTDLTAAGRGVIGAANAAAQRTILGLGALATLDTVAAVQIDNGAVEENKILASAVTTAKVADDAITYAKIQNVSATDKVLGRSTAGAGDVQEITCTAAGRALIDDADAAAQRTTLGLAALALLASVGTSQIDNDAVTYAKMQNVSATSKVLGRATAGAGDVEEIACTAAGRALIDDADTTEQRATLGLAALAVLATVGTTQIDNDAVTYAKMQNVSATDKLLGRSTAGAGDVEEITCTATARSILDDTTTDAVLATLGTNKHRTFQGGQVALSASTTINITALDLAVLAGEVWTLDYFIPFTVSGGTAGLKPIFTLPASSSGQMDGYGTVASVTGFSYSHSTTPGTAMAVAFGTASFTGFIRVRATITITVNGTIRFGVATGASAAGNLLAGSSVQATRV